MSPQRRLSISTLPVICASKLYDGIDKRQYYYGTVRIDASTHDVSDGHQLCCPRPQVRTPVGSPGVAMMFISTTELGVMPSGLGCRRPRNTRRCPADCFRFTSSSLSLAPR
eukprot:15697005-Heterocapsa_arctica.AAC.1